MSAGRWSAAVVGGATFEEIGRELGVSRGTAHAIFENAIRKLRKHPDRLRQFRELVVLRASMRQPDPWQRCREFYAADEIAEKGGPIVP